jgi:hypothetical protein
MENGSQHLQIIIRQFHSVLIYFRNLKIIRYITNITYILYSISKKFACVGHAGCYGEKPDEVRRGYPEAEQEVGRF